MVQGNFIDSKDHEEQDSTTYWFYGPGAAGMMEGNPHPLLEISIELRIRLPRTHQLRFLSVSLFTITKLSHGDFRL